MRLPSGNYALAETNSVRAVDNSLVEEMMLGFLERYKPGNVEQILYTWKKFLPIGIK